MWNREPNRIATKENRMTSQNKTTAKLLAWVLVLQVLTLAGQWAGSSFGTKQAQAQIPDAGAQRMAMVEELKSTNSKLDRLIALLESGKLQVQAVVPDERDNRPAPRPAR